MLETCHSSSFNHTTILKSCRYHRPTLQLRSLSLKAGDSTPCLTDTEAEPGLELGRLLLPLHHTVFEEKTHSSPRRQEQHPDLRIHEEGTLLHCNVGTDFSLMSYSSSTLFSEFWWASICRNLPETPSVWRGSLRGIWFTLSSRFSKAYSWIMIPSNPNK